MIYDMLKINITLKNKNCLILVDGVKASSISLRFRNSLQNDSLIR